MKTTMKKLLSFVLVAVLLVSAIPFQASAITLNNQRVVFVYKENGVEVGRYTGQDRLNGEFGDEEIKSSAQNFLPGAAPGYDFISIDTNSPYTSGSDVFYDVTVQKHIEEMYAVVIELVVTDGGTYQYNVGEVKKGEASSTMSKADAILKLNGRGSEYEITTTQATAQEGTSKYVYSFSAEKKQTNVTVTVNYTYGGQNYTTTITVPAGSTVTADQIAQAIKDQLGNQNITVTVPNNSITVGQNTVVTATVSSSSNVTLTVNVTGDANGTVTMSVAPGTAVKRDEIEAAIKQLGISDFTFTLNASTPITVNQNTVVTATVTKNNQNNVTLTVSVSGDYTGTAKMSVAPGTTVTASKIKSAVQSSLNITDSFSLDRTASITVNEDTTIYVRATKDSSSTKFPYSVYLHIYAKGNVSTPIKTVTLDTWTCVKDGVITLDEVKDVVKTYYTSKDSDGIGYDGIYYSTSSTKTDYVNDENKTSRINNLDELRSEGYVHLNVWIDNYKAKTTSNADPSNPKTGDTFSATMTVMTISASALVLVYLFNKKRAIVK